jgi:hypothetical protein
VDTPRQLLGEDAYFAEVGGPLAAPPNYTSKALETFARVKTGDGLLFGFTVTNTNAAARFALLFDTSVLPANGAVPIFAKSVPAGDAVGFSWIPPRSFQAGCFIVNSTTQATLTIGAADQLYDAQYA